MVAWYSRRVGVESGFCRRGPKFPKPPHCGSFSDKFHSPLLQIVAMVVVKMVGRERLWDDAFGGRDGKNCLCGSGPNLVGD